MGILSDLTKKMRDVIFLLFILVFLATSVTAQQSEFTDKTLDQVRNLTKEQIIMGITNRLNNLTKRQILELSYKLTEESNVSSEKYRGDGQPTEKLTVIKDILNNVVRKEKITWTYYPRGEVDEISIIKFDPTDKELSKMVIKHFTDGRQPIAR